MIYLYKRGTGMGRLARELGLSISVPYEKRELKRRQDLNLNWGCRRVEGLPEDTLNRDISRGASKVESFKVWQKAGIQIPRWHTDVKTLLQKIGGDISILARRDGLSKGKGISLIRDGDEVPRADFYVERLSCQREFRVHVFDENVILTQAKVIPPGCTNFIHNYENGCHYTSQNLDRWLPTEKEVINLNTMAINAVKTLGLDFGAVDFLLTKKGRLYCLEVNTAPGLRSDATYTAYREALKRELKKRGEGNA
jgi:hypothetical protein